MFSYSSIPPQSNHCLIPLGLQPDLSHFPSSSPSPSLSSHAGPSAHDDVRLPASGTVRTQPTRQMLFGVLFEVHAVGNSESIFRYIFPWRTTWCSPSVILTTTSIRTAIFKHYFTDQTNSLDLYNARLSQTYWNPQMFENSILFALIIVWAPSYHFWKCCDIMSLWCCLNCELCQTVEFVSCVRKLENPINDEVVCSNEKITRSFDSFVISLKYPFLYTCICSSISIASSFQLSTSLASYSLLSWLTTDCPLHVLLTSLCFLYPLDLLYPFSLHAASRQAESSPRVAFADNNTDTCENEVLSFRTEVGWSAYESVLHSKIVWIAKLGRESRR